MDRPVVALVTAPVAEAERIASAVVESRCAACVNVVPLVRSVYRWKGELVREEEALLVVKTMASRIDALRDLLAETHPYENFELVALDVVGGAPAYLDWIAEATRPA